MSANPKRPLGSSRGPERGARRDNGLTAGRAEVLIALSSRLDEFGELTADDVMGRAEVAGGEPRTVAETGRGGGAGRGYEIGGVDAHHVE